MRLKLAVCLCFAAVFSAARAAEKFQFADDFSSYADGSAGEPRWDALHVGFGVLEKAMRADVPDGRGFAVLKAAPLGRALTMEANLTPHQAIGNGWKTAGIGVFLDTKNYWHVALVEAPDGKHFVELSEMLDGQWNAQIAPDTKLTAAEETGPFAWQNGQTYRLRLTLSREGERGRIAGEVFEGGASRYRCVRSLDGRAVDRGRPMLAASFFAASFADVRVNVTETAEAPPAAAAKTFPAFESSLLMQNKPRRATGFFRTEADGDTWWLVDPNGKRTLSIGTDHVRYDGHWCEALGYAPYGRNAARKYGSADAWAREATRRLREWNFNVLGAGSSPQTRYRGLAHTEFLSFGADFSGVAALVAKTTWTGWPDVFDPRFERFCELHARERCEASRDDPWLLGYFLDNELEWWGKSHRPWGMAEDACKLPATAAGKKALVASLRAFFKNDAAAFNAEFGAKLGSFDELTALTDLPQPKTDRAKDALAGFIAEAAARYFQITTAAVRRHDPNHLVLGCRFAHDAPDSAWRQAGATCDVVTVNVYPRIDLWRDRTVGLEEHLRTHFTLCRKPIILTEWGFPALDAKDTEGRPLPSRHGAGMRVDTQEQKARCYAIMQRELFATPFVVGSHWFMWADEPSRGVSSAFPEDSDYGLVSETDEPYPALTATAARVNAQMIALHAGEIKIADVPSGGQKPRTTPPVPAAKGELHFEKNAGGCTVETGSLRLVKSAAGGKIFDRIDWRADAKSDWIELGSYDDVMHVNDGGQNSWTHADRVTGIEAREQKPERLVLDIECVHTAAPAWKTAYRLTFEPGRSWFRAKCLWVENTGDRAWHLGACFHYLPSRIGGDASDDELGAGSVPNYWLKVASWYDPALRLHYGALSPNNDERVTCRFYKEGAMQHPDCLRKIERDLKPSERWTGEADEPEVLIFGLRETPDSPRPWAELVSPPAR
jgi:hypothetical protein